MKKILLAFIALPLSLIADEPIMMWIVNNCGKPIQFIVNQVPYTITQGEHSAESFIDWGFDIPMNGQPKKIILSDIDAPGRWGNSFLRISEATRCSVCVPNQNGVACSIVNVPIKDHAAYRVRYDRGHAIAEELDKNSVQLTFE